MRKFMLSLFVLGSCAVSARDLTPELINQMQRIQSPRIEGDTLFIEGTIGSHIYDFIAFEAKALKSVRQVSLNSLGGNVEWGLEVAKKLRDLKIDTVLSSDHFCASACVYLFAAGVHRMAAEGTWLGIHGARLGAGYTTTFQGLCFAGDQYQADQPGCAEFRAHWSTLTRASTDAAFAFMESNGVSPQLRESYYDLPDDPAWAADLNILRKPDWPLSRAEAQRFGLVN